MATSGRSPGGKTGNVNAGKYVYPVDRSMAWAGVDQGVDFTGPGNIFAIGDCQVFAFNPHSGWPGEHMFMAYKITSGSATGTCVYIAEDWSPVAGTRNGSTFTAGQQIGHASGSGAAPGIETGFANSSSGEPIAPLPAKGVPTSEGTKFNDWLTQLKNGGGQQIPGGTPGSAGANNSNSGANTLSPQVAKAAAFSTFLDLPGVFDTFESRALGGNKSLMNDQPLLPFIEQLCQGSLRNFQSMPNGNFFAFYPDYFGGLSHRTPYWNIEDIEIIDGSIDLSDDPLATHVYVVGDIVGFDGQVDITDKLFSSGVVTLFDAISANFITGTTASQTSSQNPSLSKPKSNSDSTAVTTDAVGSAVKNVGDATATISKGLTDKNDVLTFLNKYGARPHFEAAPMVRSPFFELFLAYQKFCLLWSRQFLTTFTFTFMPELFPGGIVAFESHGIQCYIDEVTHNFDYETGFTTQANLTAPAALPNSNRKNVHEGMIRAFSLGSDLPFDPFAASASAKSGNQAVRPNEHS